MYLPSFADAGFLAAAERAAPPTSGLTPLEHRVIAIARREADRGRWDASRPRAAIIRRIGAALRWLTGARPVAALADARLEQLRMFVALTRRGDARARPAAGALIAAGYPPETIGAINALARG